MKTFVCIIFKMLIMLLHVYHEFFKRKALMIWKSLSRRFRVKKTLKTDFWLFGVFSERR